MIKVPARSWMTGCPHKVKSKACQLAEFAGGEKLRNGIIFEHTAQGSTVGQVTWQERTHACTVSKCHRQTREKGRGTYG